MARDISAGDRLIAAVDRVLKTVAPGSTQARRENPAADAAAFDYPGDDAHRARTAGMMRINHTGEVCAQALYQGQALTASDPQIKAAMAESADEEIDHLAWCEQRLKELDSRTSLLNPIFYGASFAIGAIAGAIGDRVSLGFVAATEDQVCQHLREHLDEIPFEDERSRKILQQMLADEAAHGSKALAAGGVEFSAEIKEVMTLLSRVMTKTTYHI